MNVVVTAGRPFAPQGARLKQARRENLGIGVNKASVRYGISWRYLIRLENGERKPSAELLARIATETGTPVDEFGYPDPDDEEEARVVTLDQLLEMRVAEILARREAEATA